MSRRAVLSLLIGGAIGLASTAVRAQAQASAMTPDTLPQIYANAMAARDAEALSAFYAERAILMTPEGPVASGREQIKALFARNFSAGPMRMIVNQARRDGDQGHAVILLDWTLEMAPPGRDPVRRRVRSMLYLRNTGSAWQIVADMYQLIPAG